MWKLLVVLVVAANVLSVTPSRAIRRKCPKNEVYDRCPVTCPPQKCGINKALIRCPPPPKPGDRRCKPGCRCIDGYVRNKSGRCIPESKCPGSKCPKNETLDPCLTSCPPRYCGVNIAAVSCLAIDPDECEPGCRCKDGYLRNTTGSCILEDDCPPQCGKHEIYAECPSYLCRPLDCSQVGYPVACPARGPNDGPDYCPGEPECVCEEGYVRDSTGQCIPMEQCPSCGGDPNAVSGCGVHCGTRCSNRDDTEPVYCILICYENACDCRDGYLYDDNTGKCVLPYDCTPTCGHNEVYSKCSNSGCGPWSCSDLGIPNDCVEMDQTDCIPGCMCKDDYVRDDNGVCIPRTECPECGGDPNAIAGCGINCGRLCSNYDQEGISCPAICYENACDCRKGYVFDENTNKCVLPENCTEQCTKPNEIYNPCPSTCPPQTCESIGKRYFCPLMPISIDDCRGACMCKDGFYRNENGDCVLEEDCPKPCTGSNEVYDPCPSDCPPQTCESIGKIYHCPLRPTYIDDCQGACRCKDGFYRNANGKCVSEKKCKKCTGPHEFFDCGSACDNECATLSEQNRTNCPIANIQCNPMCYCADGYARDANHICVPIDECPDSHVCGVNERWEQCPAWLCEPQTCDDLGFPIDCPGIPGDSSCPGPPGCVCDYNYVRDKNGICIPKKQCPSCGGDPNAQSGCGLNCGRLCSNYDQGPVPCPRICYPNACDCKKDYVFDENTGKCVLPEQCTQPCGMYEVYDSCANGGCQKRNCSQIEDPTICIDPIECNGACVCQNGYLRAKNGSCIPVEQCPEAKCKKPHEVFVRCPYFCPPQTCETIGIAFPCAPPPDDPEFCQGACMCEGGYYRNHIGECISEADCLKCTGPNEYFSCGSACDNECSTLYSYNQTNCPIKKKKCTKRCYCYEGYARDDNNICIPVDQCGVSCNGDPNAIPGCGSNCGSRCSDINVPGIFACPYFCLLHGCDCKQGYYYDDNQKKCVLPQECTRVCGENEVYDHCANGGCSKRKCSELSEPALCSDPIECIGDCVCVSGYLRNEHGLCVPEDQCYLKCMGPHEYFSCRGACDNVCATLHEHNQTNCPIINEACNPMCYCEEGYARNYSNICIPISDKATGDDCFK